MIKKIKPEEINNLDLDFLNFQTTAEIPPSEGFIGQRRAKEALDLGIKIKEKGYNIFVTGVTGTGRRTFVQTMLQETAKKLPTPNDWGYVFNFENPYEPKVISFKAGQGKKFKKSLENLINEVVEVLNKSFESEEFAGKISEIEERYSLMKKQLWEDLEAKAKELGFAVQLTPAGVVMLPIINGKPLPPEAVNALPEEAKKEIEERQIKLKHLVDGTLYRIRKLDVEFRKSLEEFHRRTALFAIEPLFAEMKSEFEGDTIKKFLEDVKKDIVENLVEFLKMDAKERKETYMRKYSLNLIVDNSDLEGAPVVFEMNPTYSNLFGKIEYYVRSGFLQTDFTMIRPGSIHKANGGFLILEAERLLSQPYVWHNLKRTLMESQITIENLESSLGISNTITLKPEKIPLDLKVIVIGTPHLYELLYELDSDFRKLFKIKADFDWEIPKNELNIQKYASFVSNVCREKNLPHFNKKALEKVIWYSMRNAKDSTKLSAIFGDIVNLIVESGEIAKMENSTITDSSHVLKAFHAMENRKNLLEEKYDEMIKRFDLMVEVTGSRVGQINGLTVLDLGDYSFGVPVKITAKAYLGRPGVVDIQREADLSGKIHSKAVLILEGFLGSRYAQEFPLSVSASISFEQVYSEVEGDSASLAEILALLSAISKVPIKQGIAVTGSINQHGEVQPVGGIIEKVEGFFRACKNRGFDGEQGVIIPKTNAKNLVLKDEIIQAMRKGLFHIWTVETVDDAIELVMGMKAGKLTKTGKYERNSINYLVCRELKKMKKLLDGTLKEISSKKKAKKGRK
ncbi:Lon protease family protein [Thermotoga sp. KOL6]|uniref:Lon protease family protein n=1 Tax=Thermotoga sp. KOL6 TaxID=126741 RepID=UPI000C763436|nr:ATP-binding protein [Thermotoga sp. KOL6]PLV60407.1 ATP-dependent protease [Thermotoga sp. KOL6]